MQEIKLVIDNETLSKYEEYYFTIYPRRKKKPIAHPWQESMNQWMIMRRPQMNALKQRWKEFICWLVETAGYTDAKIDKCELWQKIYMPTQRRSDLDNQNPKMLQDGLVESGMIVDDDYRHITKLVLECGYDKENPRTELIIKVID